MSGKIAFIVIAIGVLILAYVGYSYLQSAQRETKTSIKPITKPKTKVKPKQKPGKKAQKPGGIRTKPRTSPTRERTETSVKPSPSTTERERPSYETGIFRYNWLKYEVTVRGNRFTYTFKNLGEDVVNGKACYHQKVIVEGPQSSEMEVWYDRGTGSCVKAVIEVAGMGRRVVPCSQASQMPASGEGMRYVGEETVSVPAGTFDCWIFQGTNYKAWISKQGLLVKWISGESEGVLIGYG